MKTHLCLKVLCCILLLASSFTVFASTVTAADDGSASLPLRTVGDQWKLVVDYKGDVGMICNMTTIITGTVMVDDLDCYEFTSVGEGTVYGTDVSGTWSTTIKEYYGKADFTLAKTAITRDATIIRPNGTSTTSQYTEINYDPPFGINSGFPLVLDKTWSASSNVTLTNEFTVDGQLSQENMTFTQTTNYVVASVEDTQTSAGSFKTYLIRGTAMDGSIQDIYYAPDARIQVKESDYDSTGNLVATMELLEYQVANQQDSLPLSTIATAVIGVGIAVSAVSFLTLKRRKPKTTPA